MTKTELTFDVLVIGSGAAGLTFALQVAENQKVAVISKGAANSGSTYYAQGGIAAVIDINDSVDAHVQDTLIAGAGLCEEQSVRFTAENGKKAIDWLEDIGVNFTKQNKELHLTREGGHSARRVVHSADATGSEVQNTLINKAQAHPNISIFEFRAAVDLIVGEKFDLQQAGCLGAYIYNTKTDKVEVFSAHKTVLATGGAKNVYLYTTSPGVASGDGIAMAWRAGCRVANLEFNQFHPTCLYHPEARNFLITEALRGEGAKLRSVGGNLFMSAYDERGELAPRDIVARAIDAEMKHHGVECVYLDISHKSPEFIKEHFPNIYNYLLEIGIDITKEAIPVVPAAHYTCGGAMTNQHGQTDVANLYAIGEVAYTGLHGANRMASNSLLECLVYAMSAAKHVNQSASQSKEHPLLPKWDDSRVTDSDEEVVVSHNWQELRRFMWDYVGIVRTTKRLERAKTRANMLSQEVDDYYGNFKINSDLIELRHLLTVSKLIIESALSRKESRGLHYTLDHPTPKTRLAGKPTVLTPENYAPSTWK